MTLLYFFGMLMRYISTALNKIPQWNAIEMEALRQWVEAIEEKDELRMI
jgi:hypothetical protein